jgi:GNAT superfamily N-acetyltransferase
VSKQRSGDAAEGAVGVAANTPGVASLDEASLGRRVSVRRRLPSEAAAAATDVVGTLVRSEDHLLVVRNRDGVDTSVARRDVVAARLVREPSTRLRRALDIDPAVLEQVAAHGWQPAEASRLGGWTLRAAAGFTGRANSVLPLGDPDRPFDDALVEVVRWYGARSLRARFQVPLPWAHALDAELERRGWEPLTPVHVMVADVPAAQEALGRSRAALDPLALPAGVSLTLASRPDDDWLATYRYRGQPLPPDGITVIAQARDPLFVTVRDAEGPVAVGRGALDSGWLGITAVDVVERARRRGYGRLVLRALLAKAQRRAVRFAYLQVADDNVAATALYTSAAFALHHDYVYRAVPEERPAR